MKKLLILIACFYFIISSCKKDEEKIWTQEQLIGSWEQTGGTDYVACGSGDNAWIRFTEEKYSEASANEDGCTNGFVMTLGYSFDGKTINAVVQEMTIQELTETRLVYKLIYQQFVIGTKEYTKLSD